ncbi:MAG: DUF4214 domain-containing protein [Acidobacteriota bacterium]
MSHKLSPRTAQLQRLIAALAIISLAVIWIGSRDSAPSLAQSQSPEYKNFEGPQVHPLTVTPDGRRLLAVNTPNNSLSVFSLTGRSLTLMAEIPVGLEPVSVAARNDSEVWVVNWLSDSVSVVDLKTWNVTRTFDVGDEPTDVIFAGQQNERAFVCVSGLSQIKVYDPNAPAAAPQVIVIRGKQPRALTGNPGNSRVFVSVFESGNQTTTVPAAQVEAAGGLPPPNPPMSASLPAAPSVGLIVKWNGSGWADESGSTRWTQFIPYTLADVDVVILDANAATASISREVRGVGTHIGNTVVDPTSNQLVVVNDEAHNDVRFEPNVRGRFLNTRVSMVNLANSNVTPVDLNPHIDYGVPLGSDAERANSLALPRDIVRAADGTLYIAATGSAKVGVLNSSGVVQARINVGQGPTGLALNQQSNLLYALNRFDETISIVDTTTRAQIATVPVGFNPEPEVVRTGRRFLYDAGFSAHGDLACASCHLDGHRDGLAWDLGDPQGQMQVVINGLGLPGLPTQSVFHPMKGPMTTQSLRGIVGTEPLHWRGDRGTLADFNTAFQSLLGGPRQLTTDEMNAFTSFTKTMTYPPNPNQNLDRTLPNPATGPNATRGSQLFNTATFDAGVLTCNQCHTASGFGTGTNKLLIPGVLLQESQDFKVPQLRGQYQKTGFFRTSGEQLTGYGFLHDGSIDTLLTFLHAPVFTFQNDNQRRDVEQFVLSFDSGIAPAVGVQVTANADNKTSSAVTNRINLLMSQATAGNCDLVVRGIYSGAPRGFLYTGNGLFQTDRQSETPVSLQQLLQSAGAGAELTFTGLPAGDGHRNALDRNKNSILDGEEALTPNALDSDQFFVWQHYSDFLSREPDAAGLQGWRDILSNCGTTVQLPCDRIEVSSAFFRSEEFQSRSYFIYRFYSIIGKIPLYSDFTPDFSKVSGFLNAQQLEANKVTFINEFMTRPEFGNKYDSLTTPTAYVDGLLQTVGLPNHPTRTAWVAALTNGTVTRAQVLRALVESAEMYHKYYNEAFVIMQYFGYLRRTADISYLQWIQTMNQTGGDYRIMINGFLNSAEYRHRFGP